MLTVEQESVATKCVVARSGAYADVSPAESVRVFSSANELLFEYDPQSGKTRLFVPKGDLELVAPRGDIRLLAGGNLRLHGQSVIINARQRLGLAVRAAAGSIQSLVSLGRRRVRVEGEQLEFEAATAKSKFRSSHSESERCETHVQDLRIAVHRMETNADCIIENATNVYRSVADLLQHTAGRMKTLVDSIYQLRTKKAFLKSEDDFKIKGEKIHLG